MATMLILTTLGPVAGFYVFALAHFWREWTGRRRQEANHIASIRSSVADGIGASAVTSKHLRRLGTHAR